MRKVKPSILLTFDVEEFDLPLEYNLQISAEEQMLIGRLGTLEIQELLTFQKTPSTLFTTATFAEHHVNLLKALSTENEIASHTFYHSSFDKEDLLNSRLVLQNISGQEINGLRMPRFKKIDTSWVSDAGYNYDSSINPTYIPGRYNNLKISRTIYKENDFFRFPVSVTPNFRIPLFWMLFKNIPYKVYKKLALETLKKDGYLSLYFHPWEFTDISKWKIPFYLKKHSQGQLTVKLNQLITDLKKEAEFETITNFLSKKII